MEQRESYISEAVSSRKDLYKFKQRFICIRVDTKLMCLDLGKELVFQFPHV